VLCARAYMCASCRVVPCRIVRAGASVFLSRGALASWLFAELTWDPTHPDLLASASSDKSVRMWDGRSGKCAANIPTKGENINIAWSPDGNVIAVGDKSDQVSFIDKRTHTLLGAPWAHKPTEVNEIAWNNSGNLFFLTTGNGTVEVFDYAGGGPAPPYEKLWSLTAHTQNCYCLEFDPKDKYFAVGSADALISLWDLATMTCVRTVDRLDWPVRTLGFSADGRVRAATLRSSAVLWPYTTFMEH
jgi:THO complex subunit 3